MLACSVRMTYCSMRSSITSKTKLLQQKWSQLQILHIKCLPMGHSTPKEHFFHQDNRNFDMWVLPSVTFKFFCWGEPEMNSKAENGEGSVCSVPLLKLKVCLVESSYIWDINGPKNAMWKKSTSFFYSILQIIERLIVAASLYLKKVPKILQRFY